jgi:cysteine desulfurase
VKDPIYLDGFATLPLAPEAREAMISVWEHPGNAGSPNASGERAAHIVAIGRSQVGALIGAAPGEIVFTSGATEANNLALIGGARAARERMPDRKRILVSAIEHRAVLEPARMLEAEGFQVSVVPVDGQGRLDLHALAQHIDENLLLASIMLVNNETGIIQPIVQAAGLVHAAGGLFHTDAAQAAGKIAIDVFELDIDYLSLSAHKCYGPMGVGALYVAAHAPNPLPLVHGGGQQGSIRPGTEPVALIAGFGAAAKVARERLTIDQIHGAELRDALLDAFATRQLRFTPVGNTGNSVAGGVALELPGVDADRLCATIARSVSLSTGSACTSGQIRSSHVLEAIGLSDNQANSVVRIYCHRYQDLSDVRAAAEHIVTAANRCRLAAGDVPQ